MQKKKLLSSAVLFMNENVDALRLEQVMEEAKPKPPLKGLTEAERAVQCMDRCIQSKGVEKGSFWMCMHKVYGVVLTC